VGTGLHSDIEALLAIALVVILVIYLAAERAIKRPKAPEGTQAARPALMIARDDYRAGILFGRVLAAVGWLLVIAVLAAAFGIFILFAPGPRAGDSNAAQMYLFVRGSLLFIAPGMLAGLVLGIGMVVAGQGARAVFDSANDTRRMRELLEKAHRPNG
jgi:hypothetical protein